MRITLEYDDETADHLAQHGVRPEEAEEVCKGNPLVLRTRQGRWLVLGRTDAGRYVTVVVAPAGGGHARIVTARSMTDAERHRYLRR